MKRHYKADKKKKQIIKLLETEYSLLEEISWRSNYPLYAKGRDNATNEIVHIKIYKYSQFVEFFVETEFLKTVLTAQGFP